MIHRLARLVAEARLRIGGLFSRSLFARRILIAFPAAAVALIAVALLTALNSERKQWGHTSMVFVATQAIDAGTEIDDTMIERVAVPSHIVPEHVRHETPRGETLRAIGNGEIFVNADFVPSAAAVGLAKDWVVVGIGATDGSLRLSGGDRVIAMADGEVICSEGEVTSAVLSEINGALHVSVAVPRSCAPLLAKSTTASQVVLALIPAS